MAGIYYNPNPPLMGAPQIVTPRNLTPPSGPEPQNPPFCGSYIPDAVAVSWAISEATRALPAPPIVAINLNPPISGPASQNPPFNGASYSVVIRACWAAIPPPISSFSGFTETGPAEVVVSNPPVVGTQVGQAVLNWHIPQSTIPILANNLTPPSGTIVATELPPLKFYGVEYLAWHVPLISVSLAQSPVPPGNVYSQHVTITCSSNLNLTKHVGKNSVAISNISSPSLVKQIAKVLSVSSISSVLIAASKAQLITLSINCVSSIAAVKQIGKIAPIAAVSSLSLTKQVSKALLIASTSTVAAIKQAGKILSISSLSSVIAIPLKVHLLNLAISCVTGVSHSLGAAKTLAISGISAVSATKHVAKSLAMSCASAIVASKSLLKNIAISCASSLSIAAIKAHLITLTIVCTTAISSSRAISHQVAVSCISAVKATKSITKNVAMSCASTVRAVASRFANLTLTIALSTSLSVQRSINKIVPIAASAVVSTLKGISKTVIIGCVSTIAIIAQSSAVAISKYARYLIGMATMLFVTGQSGVQITGTTMTTTHDIIDFVCGTDWEFTGPLNDANGNPLSLVGATVTWRLDSIDGTQNFVICDNGSNGGVSIISASAGTILVDVPPSKTRNLSAGSYRDWLIVTLGNGQILTEWTGIIRAAVSPA